MIALGASDKNDSPLARLRCGLRHNTGPLRFALSTRRVVRSTNTPTMMGSTISFLLEVSQLLVYCLKHRYWPNNCSAFASDPDGAHVSDILQHRLTGTLAATLRARSCAHAKGRPDEHRYSEVV